MIVLPQHRSWVESRRGRNTSKVGTWRKRYDRYLWDSGKSGELVAPYRAGSHQSQKKAHVSQHSSKIVVPGDALSLEETVRRGVMDQISCLTPIGKVRLSWLSLELVKGQASGQGVIRRGNTTRITSVSYTSIGHSRRLIAHETPTATCACGSHLNFAECGMARAFAASYLDSRLRRPPPTLRLTARLISPGLGSHPKPGMWD